MYRRAASNFKPRYLGAASDSMETDTTRLASQGLDVVSSLAAKGITAAGARKLEQEKRKTAKATKKYDIKIEASKSKSAEAQARAAEADAAARKAEAEASSRAQTAKYAVYGSVGLAAVLAGVLIVKTFRR
jgi:hypothetical protein